MYCSFSQCQLHWIHIPPCLCSNPYHRRVAGPLQLFPFHLLENLKEKECAHQFAVDIYLHINPHMLHISHIWSHIFCRNSTKIKTVLSRPIRIRSTHFALQVHVSPCKSMRPSFTSDSRSFLIIPHVHAPLPSGSKVHAPTF